MCRILPFIDVGFFQGKKNVLQEPLILDHWEAPDLSRVALARQKNAELGTISNATEARRGW